MVRGIWVEPDKGISRFVQVARFSVPADMPREHVATKVYPEMAAQWIRDYEKRGFTLDSRIVLIPKEYPHIELPANGTVGVGRIEHDPLKRAEVDRKMVAYFRKRDIVVEVLPEAEKAAIRAYYSNQLRQRRELVR